MSVTLLSSDLPLAYQRGFQNFYGRDFFVNPNVLIPRPETEQAIDVVLKLAGKSYLPGVKPQKRVLPINPIILDVGTGSGCIAITLSLEIPEATVYATDISKEAVKIAQKNAKTMNAPIRLIISHLLDKVKNGAIPKPDLIVANLPYVDPDWDWLDKKALSFEPQNALYAKDHGLSLVKELIDQATKLQIPYLILEADPCEHQAIINYGKDYVLQEVVGFILNMRLK